MPETQQLDIESNILSSSLLVGLFNQIMDDKTVVVLDMGLASAASVSFFGQTKIYEGKELAPRIRCVFLP
mgnify:CR=1 FL=1